MPAGYVALEYLSGSQGCIATDIYLTLSDIVFVDFTPVSPTTNYTSQYCTVFTDRGYKMSSVPNAWGVYTEKRNASEVSVYTRLARDTVNGNVDYSTTSYYPNGTRLSHFFYNSFRLDSDGVILPSSVAQTGPVSLLYGTYLSATIVSVFKVPHLLYQFAVYGNDG